LAWRGVAWRPTLKSQFARPPVKELYNLLETFAATTSPLDSNPATPADRDVAVYRAAAGPTISPSQLSGPGKLFWSVTFYCRIDGPSKQPSTRSENPENSKPEA